jgi:hypothetical protein
VRRRRPHACRRGQGRGLELHVGVSDAGREVVGAAAAATAIVLGTAVFIAWA